MPGLIIDLMLREIFFFNTLITMVKYYWIQMELLLLKFQVNRSLSICVPIAWVVYLLLGRISVAV